MKDLSYVSTPKDQANQETISQAGAQEDCLVAGLDHVEHWDGAPSFTLACAPPSSDSTPLYQRLAFVALGMLLEWWAQ